MAKFTRPLGPGASVSPQYWIQHDPADLARCMDLIKPKWWYNWAPFRYQHQAFPNYIPMVWRDEMLEPGFEEVIRDHPDIVWLLFNEGHLGSQANITPAWAFHLTKIFIKLAWKVGVTGCYAAPGIIMSEDGFAWGREYHRLCRQHFLHRPAYLHLHAYSDRGMAARQKMWEDFDREWDIWGAGAPVIITEVASQNDPLRYQKEVMDDIRAHYEDDERIVGVAWYILNTWEGDIFPNAGLVDASDLANPKLTPLGEHWVALNWNSVHKEGMD